MNMETRKDLFGEEYPELPETAEDQFMQPETSEEYPMYAEIEDTSKRDENIKYYHLQGGLERARVYPVPVHYQNEGRWDEIDNTLEVFQEQGRNYYKNKACSFTVILPETLREDQFLFLWQKDQYRIVCRNHRSLQVLQAVNPFKPNDAAKPDANSKLMSELTYIDITQSIEVKARISGDGFTLTTRQGKTQGNLEYLFQLENLQLVESKDGLLLTDITDSSHIVAKLLKPQMISNNETLEYHDFGDYELKYIKQGDQRKRNYLLTYMPEPSQMQVMSDPVEIQNIRIALPAGNPQDSSVNSKLPTSNYGQSDQSAVGLSSNGGTSRTYIQFPKLPNLLPGDRVTSARLNITRASQTGDPLITIHQVKSGWEEDKITWENKPSFDPVIEDFKNTKRDLYSFDVTFAVFKWYWDSPTDVNKVNHGLLLKNYDETAGYTRFYAMQNKTNVPTLNVDYMNCSGILDMWTYHTWDVGRAGTVYTHDYTGNVIVIVNDVVLSGNILPCDLKHVYNTNYKDDNSGYGYGWRLNYMQEVEKLTGGYYRYTDGTGNRHFFKYDSANRIYADELSHDLFLRENGSFIDIIDKTGNKLRFTGGRLTSILDHNYKEGQNTNRLDITYNSAGKIIEIKDGAGRITTLFYANGFLSRIASPDGKNLNMRYYSGSNGLSRIIYPDEQWVRYTYESASSVVQNAINSISDIDGYGIKFSYADFMPCRVANIQTLNNTQGVSGQSLGINYWGSSNKFTDNNGNTEIYQFNFLGQTLSVQGKDDLTSFQRYDTTPGNQDKVMEESLPQRHIVNLLENPSAERDGTWKFYTTGAAGDFSGYSTEKSSIGKQSLKLTMQTNDVLFYQDVPAVPGSTYTVSCDVFGQSQTSGKDIYFTFEFTYYPPSGNRITVSSELIRAKNNTWSRKHYTVSIPDNTSLARGSVSLRIKLPKISPAKGSLYCDAIQLETGRVANRYNLVENNDFTKELNAFEVLPANSASIINTTDIHHPNDLSAPVVRFVSDLKNNKQVRQRILVNGKKGDVFQFGCFARATSVPLDTLANIGMFRLTLNFEMGSKVVGSKILNFDRESRYWQYLNGTVPAPAAYDAVTIWLQYNINANTAWFDGAEVFRQENRQYYDYKSSSGTSGNGNLHTVTNQLKDSEHFRYLAQLPPYLNNNVNEYEDALGNVSHFDYDNANNLIESQSPEGVRDNSVYDIKGNLIESRTGDDSLFIRQNYEYDQSGSFQTASIDERGKRTSYEYDMNTGNLLSVTDPKGNETSYEYDIMNRIITLTPSNALSAVTYTYAGDNTDTITQNGLTYKFEYDALGNLTSLGIGDNPFYTATYNPQNSLVSQMQYANGGNVNYIYDKADNLTEVRYGLSPIFQYDYDARGNIGRIGDIRNGIVTYLYYDDLNQLIHQDRNDNFEFYYGYDANSSLISTDYAENGVSFKTAYEYDKDTRPSKTIMPNGSQVTYQYNTLGQMISFASNIPSFSGNITYVPGARESSTSLIESYRFANRTYQYRYDDLGFISEISQAGMLKTYQYDNMNQLAREDDQVLNRTILYSYDPSGNIMDKSVYEYTTGDPAVLLSKLTYTYDNIWKDKLLGTNSQDFTTGTSSVMSISYDACGNPLVYGDKNIRWSAGTLLDQITSQASMYTVNFSYNQDGFRVSKGVSGFYLGNYKWDYILDGGKIVQQTRTWDSEILKIRFIYDATGSLTGLVHNGKYYCYTRNAQNDIIGIVDASGTEVVAYTYDTWGKMINVTGSMAYSVGIDNPFRYRGYFYDEETDLYYLDSRYYDPAAGRFISPDSALNAEDNGRYNMYMYCQNNPVMYSDPSGHSSWYSSRWFISGAINLAISAIMGIAAGAVTRYFANRVIKIGQKRAQVEFSRMLTKALKRAKLTEKIVNKVIALVSFSFLIITSFFDIGGIIFDIVDARDKKPKSGYWEF